MQFNYDYDALRCGKAILDRYTELCYALKAKDNKTIEKCLLEPIATSKTIDDYRKHKLLIEDDYTFEYADYTFEIAECVAGDKTLDRVVVFMYKDDEPPKLVPNAWHFGDDAIPGMPVPDDILDAIDSFLNAIEEE